MKKIYHYLIAFGMMAALGLTLGACEVCPPSESEEEMVAGGYDSEVYVKQVNIGKHEYYLVYATCDGGPRHSLRKCSDVHCFLRHSPDCPCLKVQPSAGDGLTEDAEDSTDPFNW